MRYSPARGFRSCGALKRPLARGRKVLSLRLRHYSTLLSGMPFLASVLLLAVLLAGCGNSNKEFKPLRVPAADASAAADSAVVKETQKSFEERLATYESKDRVLWQKPELVIEMLGDLSDKTVADIGAGSGFFARRLAHKARKVIAIEIDPRFIAFMDSIKRVELPVELQDRFETRLAEPQNSHLKPGEADVILLVNTYIYIRDKEAYLRHLLEVLPEGGKLVIVDFKKKKLPMKNPPQSLRMPLYLLEQQLEQAGFTLLASNDAVLDYQYIVIAQK